ncbi:TPA: type VI secretion system contractile sheath large subunit [bacterium]|nr:type VI secretion system contractile sheath large subunit [bacterium]
MADNNTNQYGRIKFGKDDDQMPLMPLRILVLSELAPRDLKNGISNVSAKYRIDKDNFGLVLSQIASKVSLNVPDKITGGKDDLIIDLPLRDINSFKPDAIAENIPILKEFLDLRDLLNSLKEHKLTPEEIEERLDRSIIGSEITSKVRSILFPTSETKPLPKIEQPKIDEDNALDAIFNMVDVSDQPTTRTYTAQGALDRIISLITSSGRDYNAIDSRAIDSAVGEIDGVLSSQINEILHHNELRRLEASWRGLKFLVDRTDFRENIQIEVISVPKKMLFETFHENIYQAEYDGTVEFSLSVVIADYEFDNSTPDTDFLLSLSNELAEIQVPMISSVGADFFGISKADDINKLPYLKEVFSKNEYVKWRGIREEESSRWITLAFNRFLLRLPYGRDNRIKRFNFEEDTHLRLWCNPAWAIGSLITSSFARIGWATEITGTRNGVIENLPVWEYTLKNGEKTYIPLETFLPMQLAGDIADIGIAPLTCQINFDSAMAVTIPTAHIPETYGDRNSMDDSILRSTLPYQLLVAKIAHYIRLIYNQIISGNSAEGIEEGFTRALIKFMSIKGNFVVDSVKVNVSPIQERMGYYDIAIHIKPGREILAGRAYIELHLQARL